MISYVLKTIIVISFICHMGTNPTTNFKCLSTKLGCLCQDLENITGSEVEPCCAKKLETLIITGSLVRNLSINIIKSKCSVSFTNLFIRETGLERFNSQFEGLNNVSYIYIERNQHLRDFDKLIFEEINSDILSINVESNSIRSISKKTFSNLAKLNALKLSDNQIGYIEDQSFSGLKNINLLYLNNNLLTLLIGEMFFGLESLTVLSLINNPLQEPKTSDIFRHLKNLRYLAMSQSTNIELKEVNQLPPKIFYHVRQLKSLNMTSIKLKNLTALTFYGLNDLENLDLQGNRLNIIPSGTLQQVPKIQSINLSRNQISCFLSDTFQNLPKLINLDVSQNELSYISEDVFKDLSQLRTLDLSENNIYVIDKNAFTGLTSLMIIKLNIIHGFAKNEIQMKFMSSPLAKLRNSTKIVGLVEFFGISSGGNQPPYMAPALTNGSRKTTDRTKILCPVASSSDKDWVDFSATGSRKYLLIIVGICVVFLLIAFAIIMTYRAWSKRRMCELAVSVEGEEKQEMLQSKNYIINGCLEKSASKSNHHSRKPINGGSSLESRTQDQVPDSNLQRHSNSHTSTDAKPPLSEDRCHSDDESALTPLGVL